MCSLFGGEPGSFCFRLFRLGNLADLGWLVHLVCSKSCLSFGNRALSGTFTFVTLAWPFLTTLIRNTRLNRLRFCRPQITRADDYAKAQVNNFSPLLEFAHPCTEVFELEVGSSGRVEGHCFLFLKLKAFKVAWIDIINVRVVPEIFKLHITFTL